MGMLYNGEKDIFDIERFDDTGREHRTKKQLMWEESIVKEGSLKERLILSFGRNDIGKLGRKVSALLLAVFIWVSIAIILPKGFGAMTAQCLSVAIIALCEQYMVTYKNSLTVFNIVYVIIILALSVLFYGIFNFVMWDMGYAIMLSSYYFLYTVIPFVAYGVRIIFMAYGSYKILGYETDTAWEKVAALLFVVAEIMGLLFRLMPSLGAYLVGVMAVVILSFLVYIKSKNKFTFKLTLVFAFWSAVEIIGYNSVVTGGMTDFVENAVW